MHSAGIMQCSVGLLAFLKSLFGMQSSRVGKNRLICIGWLTLQMPVAAWLHSGAENPVRVSHESGAKARP